MADIHLIKKDSVLPKLQHMNWDVVINNHPYYVVRIPGFVHTIGGKYGENDFWAYPRDEEPSYENLIEFSCDNPVSWGIEYKPFNSSKCKWDEVEAHSHGTVTITRNGKKFYEAPSGINYGIDNARVMIVELQEHPINFNEIGYEEKNMGRKVWWRSEPAKITSFTRDGCVILEPDGIEKFSTPAEFASEATGDEFYEDGFVKADFLDKHIWWFRE